MLVTGFECPVLRSKSTQRGLWRTTPSVGLTTFLILEHRRCSCSSYSSVESVFKALEMTVHLVKAFIEVLSLVWCGVVWCGFSS